MPSLVVLGASGFLGRAFITHGSFDFPIKAVSRNILPYQNSYTNGVSWYGADLLVPGSLDEIIDPGDIVINLAFSNQSTASRDNLCMFNNIIDACFRCKVSKLVHCSTAVVVGNVKNVRVDETTVCIPANTYEQIKLDMEQCLLEAVSKGLNALILRPTAIVGANGLNLRKLADSLMNGSSIMNYARACLCSKRKMNLVSIHNVIAALRHLAIKQDLPNGGIYLISSDEDLENNFLDVEKILIKSLGLKLRVFPILPVPLLCLSLLLKIRHRSSGNVSRIYDSKKIQNTKFIQMHSVRDAIDEFGEEITKASKRNSCCDTK